MMGIADGIRWRFEVYVEPHLLLHESPAHRLRRMWRNFKLGRRPASPVYLYADAANLGDRASNLGVKHLAGIQGLEMFASPPAMQSSFRHLDKLIRNGADPRLIIGGGGLLQECFAPFWEGILKRDVPFALFGIGANQLEGPRNLSDQETLREIARKAAFIHVRDNFTANLILPYSPRKLVRGPCPSIQFLMSREASRGQGKGAEPKRDLLLHVIHPADLRLNNIDADGFRAMVRKLAGSLGLEYAETDHVHMGLEGALGLYRRAKQVVTSRLHGAMFSFALGVPFAPVVCDVKMKAFMDDYLPESTVLPPNCGLPEISAALRANESLFQRAAEGFLEWPARNAAWMAEALAALGL